MNEEVASVFENLGGDSEAFRSWCLQEIIDNGAMCDVVDGVHRNDLLQKNDASLRQRPPICFEAERSFGTDLNSRFRIGVDQPGA